MQDPCPQQRQKMDIKISGLSGGRASCISGEDVCWWWSECISTLRALDLGHPDGMGGQQGGLTSTSPLYDLGEGRLKLQKRKNQMPCVGCVVFDLLVFNILKFFI